MSAPHSGALPVSGIAAKTSLAHFEGRLTGGTGAANSYLFNTKGSGPGVWTGIGTTKTKASSTIFVTNIPRDCALEQVQGLFATLPGFISFRTVRRLAFVDFNTIAQATEAMRTFQGYVLPGFESTIALSSVWRIDTPRRFVWLMTKHVFERVF